MYGDDLSMLEFTVNGGSLMWLLLVGMPLLPVVFWAAHRAGETRSTLRRAGFVATAIVACAPFLVGAISFAIGMSKPFYGARAVSRSATCQSNLRELSRSMQVYASDSDDTLPPADRWADRVGERTTLSPDWFECPSSDVKFSYAFNRWLGKVRMSDIEEPAATLMLFECDAAGRSESGIERDVTRLIRHPAGTFIAFADGHLSRYRQSGDRPIHWDPKVSTYKSDSSIPKQ